MSITISSAVFAISFCTIYTMGYIGILMGSFFITVLGITLLFSVNYPEKYLNLVKNTMNMVKNLDNDQITISPCKQYYTYNGIHYDIAFPLFWVLTEKPECGPHNCDNCRDYGTFRGVFIMYCVNCAEFDYNNIVGYGAIHNGIELIDGHNIEKSAWRTYLKDRDIKRIGLPEELEEIDFEREGYEYKLTYETDENGMITKYYPDFVLIDEEDHYELEYEHEDEPYDY